MTYDILALLAGLALAVVFWKAPRSLLRISAAGALLLTILLGALAVTGWPLYRVRLHQRPDSSSLTTMQQAHSLGGHLSLWPVALLAPLFVAAALRRDSNAGRKAFHVFLSVFIVVAWVLISFSGYMLPKNLPSPLPREIAPTVLRFALLHMFGLPLLLGVALLLSAWRHWRASSRVPAV